MKIDTQSALDMFRRKIEKANMHPIVFENFSHYYKQYRDGNKGYILESDITPVSDLPKLNEIDASIKAIGQKNKDNTVVLKLNGGLGTGMGLERAKSLLTAKQNMSFLEIIARQVKQDAMRLLLMNSFATRSDSLAVLDNVLPSTGIAVDFLQNQIPKIDLETKLPVEHPEDPALEWCPPGHGDLYVAIAQSGVLDGLLVLGYEYIFVSNADNLGAVFEPEILGYFIENQLDFMMEVSERTPADNKGGHLALRDGHFILRESAQCEEKDKSTFEDIKRHQYFNTNNLWIRLKALYDLIHQKKYQLGLPLIVNEKTVDPKDKASTPVIQLETAMGAAIGVFENAGALEVDRSRFAPVKNTNQLLKIRSDLYELTDKFKLKPTCENAFNIHIDLDKDYYKNIADFEKRFSFFYDFDAAAPLPSIQAAAHEEIFERLTQDIFNASLGNW